MASNQKDWFHNDELFFKELDVGYAHAEVVKQQLCAEGLNAFIPSQVADHRPRRLPGEQYDAAVHRDESFKSVEKDLVVEGFGVEIKSRALQFTSPGDYPYRTAFVDTCEGWLAKDEKPIAVVLISQITKRSVVVSTRAWETQWAKCRVYDRKRQIYVNNFEVAKGDLRTWEEFIFWLRAHSAVAA